ncbi:hypothetical protein QUF86_06335 [Peribacillus sp. NJ11]|nr:hypothetical protein [Peribacillus sp. NJ11]MDM5220368.1 hypothetical protein [Peribacillus sp. NJ11]
MNFALLLVSFALLLVNLGKMGAMLFVVDASRPYKKMKPRY